MDDEWPEKIKNYLRIKNINLIEQIAGLNNVPKLL